MLRYLRFRYTKARMTAYLNDELPAQTRRFIARQIDSDSRCYDEYIRQRQTKNELDRTLPSFGRADRQQLSTIWANIQADLAKPLDPNPVTTKRPTYQLGYGVCIVVLVALLMLVPFSFDAQTVSAQTAPTQPPIPDLVVTVETKKQATVNPTFVAYLESVETVATIEAETAIKNTPVPDTPGA